MTLRPLSSQVFAARQINQQDLEDARQRGVALVINNRLDGEDPDQPSSAEMEERVRAAGLDYAWVPVAGRPTQADADALVGLLADGRSALIYCRSGMRSAATWAMAAVGSGAMSADEARAAALEAGFDLSGLPL